MISNQLKIFFIAISLLILIFLIIKIFGESAGSVLLLFSLFLIGVFLILNSRRFIKYQKWYLGPDFMDMFIYKDEKTIAWIYLIGGIVVVIFSFFVLIGIFVGTIFGG